MPFNGMRALKRRQRTVGEVVPHPLQQTNVTQHCGRSCTAHHALANRMTIIPCCSHIAWYSARSSLRTTVLSTSSTCIPVLLKCYGMLNLLRGDLTFYPVETLSRVYIALFHVNEENLHFTFPLRLEALPRARKV